MTNVLAALVYALAVCTVAYFVGKNAAPTGTVAADTLPANHRLADKDLAPADREALVGKYLRAKKEKGVPITSADVAESPIPANAPNSLAAAIAVPRSRVLVDDIRVGTKVQICKGATALGAAGEVRSVQCEGAWCSVLVVLAKAEGIASSADLAEATVALAGKSSPCMAP